jgi:DNA polymerase III alpha subunit
MDKTSVIALIKSGSLDSISSLSRADLLKLYFSYRFDAKKEEDKPIQNVNKNHIKFLFDNGLIAPEQQTDKELCTKIFNKSRKSQSWVDFQEKYMEGTELDWEMETLQSFMSGNPFDGIELPDWSLVFKEESGWVGGTINNVTKTKVKKEGKFKGQSMAFINIDTNFGVIDCVVFPENWLKYQDILKLGKNVVINGEKQSDLSMVCNRVLTLEEYKIKMGVE